MPGTLETRLHKTRQSLVGRIRSVFTAPGSIGQQQLKDLEAQLLLADVGLPVASEVVDAVADALSRHALKDQAQILAAIEAKLIEILAPVCQPLEIPQSDQPFVILVVGINGAGKTTTIAKLAKHFTDQGRKVVLAAGDTFRAAAVEQLKAWGQRLGIKVIAQKEGADSASVIFDAINSAAAGGADIVLADTAGRLHTQSHLMEELKKVSRVAGKAQSGAPHEVLLVLDGHTGQNALIQARQFNEALNVTGCVVTKLDGTAKGGIVFAIAKELGIALRAIGVGEQAEDLKFIPADAFVDSLFSQKHESSIREPSPPNARVNSGTLRWWFCVLALALSIGMYAFARLG